MRNRISHWTALFLLVMSGAAFGAQVGSMFCVAGTQGAPSLITAVALPQAQQPDCGSGEACPLATLAEFVASPMVMSPLAWAGATCAAYVAPLYLSTRYRVDPEPPTKPPSA